MFSIFLNSFLNFNKIVFKVLNISSNLLKKISNFLKIIIILFKNFEQFFKIVYANLYIKFIKSMLSNFCCMSFPHIEIQSTHLQVS